MLKKMNQIKKKTFMDRISNSIKAFCGKPIGAITYGLEVKKCSECGDKLRVVLYECDKEACGDKCPNPLCHLTRDIAHAVNFEVTECVNGMVYYDEKPRGTINHFPEEINETN